MLPDDNNHLIFGRKSSKGAFVVKGEFHKISMIIHFMLSVLVVPLIPLALPPIHPQANNLLVPAQKQPDLIAKLIPQKLPTINANMSLPIILHTNIIG